MENQNPDKAELARRSRCKPYPEKDGETIGGIVLQLHKWTFDMTMEFANPLIEVIKLVAKDSRPAAIQELLKQDLNQLIVRFKDQLLIVIAATVTEGNFKDRENALLWVKELAIDDLATLLKEIGRRNLVSFAAALGFRSDMLPAELKETLESIKELRGTNTPKS